MPKLKSHFQKIKIEAGCDEAGRGCLAGPVVAAAVILPKNYKNSQINDSKKLNHYQRNQLREIIERDSLAYAVGMLDNNEIDKVNILNASFLAMHKAIDQLFIKPEFLLIDGNRFIPYPEIEHNCIIKGDAKYLSIAAASILAKTYRDDLMEKLHSQHPEYGWVQNKGYPTKKHRDAIKTFGVTDFHRKSFNLFSRQLELNLDVKGN